MPLLTARGGVSGAVLDGRLILFGPFPPAAGEVASEIEVAKTNNESAENGPGAGSLFE